MIIRVKEEACVSANRSDALSISGFFFLLTFLSKLHTHFLLSLLLPPFFFAASPVRKRQSIFFLCKK